MERTNGRLRAAWLAPCIGTGGADALMSGLVRACQTVSFTGVGILRSGQTIQQQVAWARANGLTCPLHLYHDSPNAHPLDVTPHRTALEAARAAVADAEIVISWCCGGPGVDMRAIYPALGIPAIELSQNEDGSIAELLAYNSPAAHYYAACSQAAARTFPENVREKVNVIYNGIDPLRCAPRQGREAMRERLEYAETDKVILYLGRFVSEKNPEAVVQALSALPEHYKALFVGRGPEQPIVESAAKRYAPGRVQVIDFVEHPGDLYAAADCFCLPSDFEGDPLAVHEAQLAGLPCVVAEYSAVEELESMFGELYWRVPPRPTTATIAAAIRQACEDPDEEPQERRSDLSRQSDPATRSDLSRQSDPATRSDLSRQSDPATRSDLSRQSDRAYRIARAREVTWRYFTLSSIAFQWEELLHECLADWRERRLRGTARRLMRPRPQVRAQ